MFKPRTYKAKPNKYSEKTSMAEKAVYVLASSLVIAFGTMFLIGVHMMATTGI